MADFNEVLSRVLSDPDAMTQLNSLASNLGLSQSSSKPAPAQSPADPGSLMNTLLRSSSQFGQDAQLTALVRALKPFLRPERAQRLDAAVQVAKVSQLAGSTLQSSQGKGRRR